MIHLPSSTLPPIFPDSSFIDVITSVKDFERRTIEDQLLSFYRLYSTTNRKSAKKFSSFQFYFRLSFVSD
jgi:hypothetical protein